MFTKHITNIEKFVHLQTGLCKCQYLCALGPIRLWTHPANPAMNIILELPANPAMNVILEHIKSIVGSNLIV